MKTIRNNKPAPWKGALTLLAALALPATAARLAYEGFDYTDADGTSINGLNGGTGWDSAYPAPNGTITLEPGLTFSGLTTVGKSMRWVPNANTGQGRNWDASSSAVPADGTYWFSAVINSSGSSQGNFNWMFSTKSTNGQNGVGVRTSNDGSGGLNFKPVHPNTDGGGETQAGTGTAGTPTLVVGRLDLVVGSNSSFRIWVNPSTDPSVVPQDTDTNSSVTTVSAADTSTLRPSIAGRCFGTNSGAGPNYMEYDEIRIGNTFAEVLPPQAGAPEFGLDPLSAVENQTLTFTWVSLPSGSNPTLNGTPVTIDGSGNGGTTLPAPAVDTTYTLAWTGAGSPLTQEFTAIDPSFSVSPGSGYLGDTLTINWQVPVGASGVTLNPGGIDLSGLTSGVDGTGSTTLPAPTSSTTYTLDYNFGGVSQLSEDFTLLDSSLVASPDRTIENLTPVTFSWRIDPAFSQEEFPEVILEGGPIGGPYLDYGDFASDTNSETGAGSTDVVPFEGEVEFRLVYNVGGSQQVLMTSIEAYPEVFTLTSGPGVVNPAPMFDGVLAYSNRNHVWAEVPSILQGAQFVKLSQDEKSNATFEISFEATQDGTFFLLLDNRIGPNQDTTNGGAPPDIGSGVMDWVLTSGFVDSGVDISLDEGDNGSVDQTYSVYFRQVAEGESFTFLEQNNGNFRNMYGIAAVSPQVTPVVLAATPEAILQGGSSTLQWTVPVGFNSVTLNPGNIDVTSDTDSVTGVGSVEVTPASDTAYTLTYDVGSGPVSIPPATVFVNSFTATPETINQGESSTLAWDIPAGATNVIISAGVGDVTTLTDSNGVGSVAVMPGATTEYTLTYTAAGEALPTNTGAVTVTVNTGGTPFDLWITANYPSLVAPDNLPGADPDDDGSTNIEEYALGGDPTDGSNNGPFRSNVDVVGGTEHLTVTFAARTGAAFTGAAPATATVDGLTYTVRGSTDLASFGEPVDEVTPAITTGLPAAPVGYTYYTFRITDVRSANPKAFLQVQASTP